MPLRSRPTTSALAAPTGDLVEHLSRGAPPRTLERRTPGIACAPIDVTFGKLLGDALAGGGQLGLFTCFVKGRRPFGGIAVGGQNGP
ncbi:MULTISPECIES: hypothetical protein [Mycolicibacterium]|uniref:hypothetical protein n=1 Tax=Mycolicibacterium TaxID=1866885 RepID=UPI001EF5D51C|nr:MULTISPECIES: hypothetical protein [Mycolicibacterium]MCG7583467.1 hypothetical protein [Mycolicibacterium sp. OfavD-34-C]